MKEEYSPYKIVHHPKKIEELRNNEQPTPLQVQIVPTNGCNHRCIFCAYRMKDSPSNEQFHNVDHLTYEKIVETLDCFVNMGIKSVQYTGGGEPLVHPKIKDIFKDTIDRNIELALVTNGSRLTEEICEMLGETSWTRVSVDAATPKLYSIMRNINASEFDKTVNNIKLLVKYRKTNVIGVGFVVDRENYKEIYQSAKMFKDLGVDNFRISAAFTPMGYEYFNGFIEEATTLAKKAEQLTDPTFTIFNMFNDRIMDNFIGIQDYDRCPIKDLLTYIGADYNIYTCCTLAYNKKGYIGSIKDQSFEDMWLSKDKEKFFKNHNPRLICQLPCMYKKKNEFINYCLTKNPKHVNYI